jgi:beta-fructofuranosidase
MPNGDRIVWGWLRGFPGGRGWNGCLSLPRYLSISRDVRLLQKPAPQLSKLRGKPADWRKVRLDEGSPAVPLPGTNTFEVLLESDLKAAKGLELQFQNGTAEQSSITVSCSGSELRVANVTAALQLPETRRTLTLRIFVDRSVMEVFADDTVCVTKVIRPLSAGSNLHLTSLGGTAKVRKIQAWPLQTIW